MAAALKPLKKNGFQSVSSAPKRQIVGSNPLVDVKTIHANISCEIVYFVFAYCSLRYGKF